MAIGISILLIFVVMAVLMYLNRLPALLALPIMAVAIAAVAGVSGRDIAAVVLAEGSVKLHLAYTTAILGAILAQLVDKTGIAETLVKKAAELGGDQPFLLALLLTLVVAVLFTTLAGLGAVIMVATIVFPILLSLGVAPIVVGCLFLFGMCVGGIFNLANWQVYKTVLDLDNTAMLTFAAPLAGILAVVTVVFAWVQMRRSGLSPMLTDGGEEEKPEERPRFVPWYALLTPVIPLLPVLFYAFRNYLVPEGQRFDFPIITAMMIGICYGAITTWRRDRSSIQLVTRSTFEGIAAVAPAVALMLGIGMLFQAVTHPDVISYIQPVVLKVIPHSPIVYVVLFTILAPLALYRGPLNVWGMGWGLAAVILATKAIPAAAIMAALFSVGIIQGVCDPTNTHNVWIANYLGIDIQQILKRTLPYAWGAAAVALVVGAILFMR